MFTIATSSSTRTTTPRQIFSAPSALARRSHSSTRGRERARQKVILGSENAKVVGWVCERRGGDQWSLRRSQVPSIRLRRNNTWNMLQKWIGSNSLQPITRGQKIFWRIMRYLSRKRGKHSTLGNRMHGN